MRHSAVLRLERWAAVAPLLTLVAATSFIACSSTTALDDTYQASPVVRAFLYAGEPVADVRLSWSMTLSSDDTTPAPINNANVALIRRGVRYNLVRAPGDSGYYRYDGSDLVVLEGDVFSFEARVGDRLITATTTVPTRPGTVTRSSDTVKVPDFGGGLGGFVPGQRPNFEFTTVTVHWPASAGSLYYVTLENLESNPQSVADSTGIFRFGPRRMVLSPTAADSMTIGFNQIRYFGQHRVRVYRVNEEYAQLYATQQQDSRDLNEPFTNVVGGLGVFSAFASDTTRLVVAKSS